MYKSENTVNERVEGLMQRMERMEISWETEKADLEKKLEGKLEEEISSLKSDMRAEVKKEVDNVLPDAVGRGLRDLPFEMVCAHKSSEEDNSYTGVVTEYDRITAEFNNSDRPGGADGTMNIETGVFTTVTSGYYIINYSAFADVHARESTTMYLHHNGARLQESSIAFALIMGSDDDWIRAQGSRTVILHLLAGDTVDLRIESNSYGIYDITLCLYMAPAPYGF